MDAHKIIKTIEQWDLKKLTKYFMILGVIIGFVAFYFWYSQLYMTTERRFWLAIDNSMSTKSVVRTLLQGGSGNEVVQDFRFHFTPQRVVENQVSYSEKSATVNTLVETEGIVYPSEQYLRYTAFVDERDSGSASLDGLIGDWAVQIASDDEEARLNYLSEQVTLVIFGNYGSEARREMLDSLKSQNVYGTQLNDALEDTVDGEDVFVYSASVNLKAYAQVLSDAFTRSGFGEFPPLNPDNYREGAGVNSTIVVRKRDNIIIGINFGGREEVYSNYGVIKQIEKPQAEMSVEELQQQVQAQIQN